VTIGRTRLRACASAAIVAGALGAVGCGGKGSRFANDPRPPVPVNVTAAISDGRVAVSPMRVGAGPVLLVVSNQSTSSQEVSVSSADGGSNDAPTKSGPINPQGTAQVQVDLKPGSYAIDGGKGTRPARLTVGPQRGSAQNQVLQP